MTAVVAIPVYLIGEPAEEAVENLPGVTEQFIAPHEDSEQYSLTAAIFAGLTALSSFTVGRSGSAEVARFVTFATLILALAASVLMARMANLGGQIRHTEIRQGAQNNQPAGGTPNGKQNQEADDDDK